MADEIEAAITAGAVGALRKRAKAQREKEAAAASDGEAYIARRLADVFEALADEIKAEP